MAALPGFFASTRPPEVTAATLGSEDDQLTAAFAVSSAEFPAVSESSLLLSLSELLEAPRTSSWQEADLPFAVEAVTTAFPAPTAVTTPFSTRTTDVSELVHATSAFSASAGVTVAVRRKVLPASSRTVR